MATLTEAELTDARRFLGYSAHGAMRGGAAGTWFYQASAAADARLAMLSDSEVDVLRGYLRTLAQMEAAIPAVAEGLDTASAAGWVRNAGELEQRERLFDGWRRRMCGFLGLVPGPELRRGGGVALLV
ncbi:MAG TPA: hypothetical protein VGC15_20155 [Acetobacteraceae bacterium]